jgi:hypothetical protein
METNQTTQFVLNVGVTPGYFHGNESKSDIESFVQLWQSKAEEVFLSTGIYVSGTVDPVKTVYRSEWGCPKGGEDTFVICGLRNSDFMKDDDLWRDAVRQVSLAVGKELGQTTAYLTFANVDFLYLKPSVKA